MGRIGKLVLRLAHEHPDIEVVQINDMMDTPLMAHLIRYDSLHGPFAHQVEHDKERVYIDGQPILVTHELSPDRILPSGGGGVDVVVDSSGRFKTAPFDSELSARRRQH